MREMRESLALAEQLAKASMNKGRPDANNNGEDDSSTPRSNYVPPKHLLLYLVRMGSFTSAAKIMNDDVQDDDVDFSCVTTHAEMKTRCQTELVSLPAMIQRQFRRVRIPSANDAGAEPIRVLQWNILSQSLSVHNDNFVSCPPEALDWRTRRYRILAEIIEHSPDVICLQEVDHFQFISKALRSVGFDGTYFPKPDSPCIYIKENNGPDGCAIFYRLNTFEVVRVETHIVEVWRVQSNQVLILTVLRHKASGRQICVATTHLKARQGALLSTLRNEQGKDILNFLEERVSNDMPIILCGDFNAEPSEPVYRTIMDDPRFNLDSAYRQQDGTEPPYTTWKIRGDGECCHTIDYIFFSQRHFNVDQRLAFPTGEQIGDHRVPSLQYPSDHFSLVADFRFN